MATILSDELKTALGALAAAGAVGLGARALGPAWDDLARRRIAQLRPQLQALRFNDAQIRRGMRIWGGALVAVVLLLTVVWPLPLLAVAAAYLIYISPAYFLGRAIERRQILLRDQLVQACVGLSNAVRSGMALAQGLAAVSRESPEPLATELRRIVADYEMGRPLGEAIAAAKERLDLESFTLFCAAILACLESGGRVTEALEGISHSLQESQRLERKIEADTASGRKVVLILTLFPFGFLAGFYAFDPDATRLLFETMPGQLVLLAVLVLVYISAEMARRILRIEV